MEKLKVGYYVRFRTLSNEVKIRKIIKIDNNIYELDKNEVTTDKYIIGEPSENIIDLIQPMDLLFVDIDNGYEGGIIVPKIAETMNELNEIKSKIKSGNLKLKYIVTREQIENLKYEVE